VRQRNLEGGCTGRAADLQTVDQNQMAIFRSVLKADVQSVRYIGKHLCCITSCSVVGWTWLKAPTMSCVRTAGYGAPFVAVFFLLMAVAIRVMVRRSASTAEFSGCAPIWKGWVAPYLRTALVSLLATIDSSSFPKQDCSEIGW